MPFNVSEEQSLLSSMLAERDAQISTLTHQLHSTSEILHATQKELQSKSSARKSQREEHSATIKRLKEEHAEQRRVLAKFEQNVKNGGGLRVHEYAALMRSANGSGVESSYVLRLQAQLCRAMHSLGVMESQLALVKENCSSLIKFMKEDLSHMVDDRTRREIELMNGLARVDCEKRVMAEEMESKMQEKEELLDQVREEYEELGLEYDENEVKKALEVKYLLEQMEKVREDKVRLEKELLAALLEREEQINRLRRETEELGTNLDGLKKEAEKRDICYEENVVVVVSKESDDRRVSQEEEDAVQHDVCVEGGEEIVGEVTGSQNDINTDRAAQVEGEEGKGADDSEIQCDDVSEVKFQTGNDTVNDPPSAKETLPNNENEGIENEGTDSDKTDSVVQAIHQDVQVGNGEEVLINVLSKETETLQNNENESIEKDGTDSDKNDSAVQATHQDVQVGNGEEVLINVLSTDDANTDENAAESDADEKKIIKDKDVGINESEAANVTLQAAQGDSGALPTTASFNNVIAERKIEGSEIVQEMATQDKEVTEANCMAVSDDHTIEDKRDSDKPQKVLPTNDGQKGNVNEGVETSSDISAVPVEEKDTSS